MSVKNPLARQPLSRQQKKELADLKTGALADEKKVLSAQDSIPYRQMYPDGICRVSETRYVKTMRFQDMNYQLSQNEDKTAVFEGWCDFLNFLDPSVSVQLTFVNVSTSEESVARQIDIPPAGDEFDSIR